jgi:hypothetical protein
MFKIGAGNWGLLLAVAECFERWCKSLRNGLDRLWAELALVVAGSNLPAVREFVLAAH